MPASVITSRPRPLRRLPVKPPALGNWPGRAGTRTDPDTEQTRQIANHRSAAPSPRRYGTHCAVEHLLGQSSFGPRGPGHPASSRWSLHRQPGKPVTPQHSDPSRSAIVPTGKPHAPNTASTERGDRRDLQDVPTDGSLRKYLSTSAQFWPSGGG